MTVRELIAELEKLDLDADVHVAPGTGESNWYGAGIIIGGLLIHAGYRGPGIVDGVEWLVQRSRNNPQVEGGRRGGIARAKALTPEQRSAIARKGGKARWGKSD